MLTHEKDRPHLAALSGLAATALFLLLLFGPCFSAHAESFDFYATTNITTGDVVIWDTSAANAKAVKAANDQYSMDVVGIAAETISAGNDVRIRFSGGKVACNISGTIDITSNPWLVVSSTTGKAEGLSSRRAGTFAKAITDTGDPQAGQCYVALNVGLSAYSVEGAESIHGNLSGLGDDDHTQYHNDARGDARYYTETELDAGQLDDRYYTETESDAAFAPIAEGVTNGDSHDHSGGDGAQIDHGGVGGLGDDDHSQYHNDARGDARYLYRENVGAFTPDADYEPATKKYVDDNDKLTVDSSFPGAPGAGDMFYHTTHDTLFQYENTVWNPLRSYSALTLYVDDGAGTDAVGKGYGSGANATATIQYCIDKCVPTTYTGNITISIAAATYNEDAVIQGKNPNGDYTITLEGGWSEQLAEATVDAGSVQGTGATQGTLVDAAPAWADDDFNNMWIVFEDDTTTTALQGIIRLIDDTTDAGDVLTIVGTWPAAPVAGDTYIIQDQGTIVDTITIGNSQKNIVFSKIHILLDTTSLSLASYYGEATFYSSKISHATGAYIWVLRDSTIALHESFIDKCQVYIDSSVFAFNRTKLLTGNSGSLIISYTHGVVNPGNGSIVDVNSANRDGVILTVSSMILCYSGASGGYNRFRNADQAGKSALLLDNGAGLSYSANNQYANNTSDKTVDGATFAWDN